MLGPILQAVWQQVGPLVQQALTVAAPYLQKIPHIYVQAAVYHLSRNVNAWYQSLDTQSRKRIDDAIAWAVKDLAGDIAAAVTGLPVSQLVEKVLDRVSEYRSSPEAKTYIKDELVRQMRTKEQQSIGPPPAE